MENSKSYYSKQELSVELGISIRTIDNWIASGLISYSKIGRRVIFSRTDIEDFVLRNKKDAMVDQNIAFNRTW